MKRSFLYIYIYICAGRPQEFLINIISVKICLKLWYILDAFSRLYFMSWYIYLYMFSLTHTHDTYDVCLRHEMLHKLQKREHEKTREIRMGEGDIIRPTCCPGFRCMSFTPWNVFLWRPSLSQGTISIQLDTSVCIFLDFYIPQFPAATLSFYEYVLLISYHEVRLWQTLPEGKNHSCPG